MTVTRMYILFALLAVGGITTLVTYATGENGLFGDYFTRMMGSCNSTEIVTGFDATPENYATRKCTGIKKILADVGIVFSDVGNIGIGLNTPEKKLDVNGAIMAKEFCFKGTNECVKTFQQTLSNTQYFNFANHNPYGGPGTATYLFYDENNASKSIKSQGPIYIRFDSDTMSKIGIDSTSDGKKSNWFTVATSYMQPYEPYPKAIFVDQGDDMSLIVDGDIAGPVSGNKNIFYCITKRKSDGYQSSSHTCDGSLKDYTVLSTHISNPAKNHGGYLGIEYRLVNGDKRECDSVIWTSNMINLSWGDPEVTNIRSTSYQSPPSPSTYPQDYCGFDNMHSQIVARFVLRDYNTVKAGSLAQFAADSPRLVKIKAIGVSLLK